MKFFAIISLLALGAIAAPTSKSSAAVREASFESALSDLKNLQANGCSITSTFLAYPLSIANEANRYGSKLECAAALAPTVVGCAAAAAQEFIDPISGTVFIAVG